jgi:ABC-type lipoprotein release transport system permease subunit
VGVFFMGVEPGRERHVSELAKKVVKGVYLGSDEAAIAKAEKKKGELWCARPPGKDQPPVKQVVVGVNLAHTLKLKLCEKLTLDAQGMGNRESESFRIVGMYQTGSSDIDGFFLQIPLAHGQRLLGVGDGVHQVSVILKNAKQSKKATAAIKAALGADKGLEILSWKEALPMMDEFISMKRVSGWVFIIIVVVIAAIGVLNTVFMSVMERTREFGVMRALGTSPGRVMGQVFMEGVVLGALGVLAGLLISWPLVYYLETTGIVYPEPVEAAGVTITAIKGKLYFWSAVEGSLFVFCTAVVAAFLPAIRAARLKVLEAIHNV